MKFFFIMKISDIYTKFLEFPNISTDSRAIKKTHYFLLLKEKILMEMNMPGKLLKRELNLQL